MPDLLKQVVQPPDKPITPFGFCECGCGQKTAFGKPSGKGWKPGTPNRFIYQHHPRKRSQVIAQPEDDSIRWIALTRGKITIVDAADYDSLMQWKWHAQFNALSDHWCAARHAWDDKNKGLVFMHREILQAPAGLEVDHRDGDGLNNRRSNIRLATVQQNSFNKGPMKSNTSGYKGVFWNKRKSMWQAQIRVNGRLIVLGLFADKQIAAKAYKEAATRIAGQFARTETFDWRKTG
jgi:HNH endonuclease